MSVLSSRRARLAAAVLTALTALVALPAAAQSTPAAPAVRTVPVTFPCQATTCDGELWLPAGVQRPPVIVMAHGFGATRDWGLKPFAERFVQAGFAVMRFDYRGFGKSGGQPRRVVDGKAHVKDWLSAIDAVKARADVNGQQLGIWGTSYSGGQVLVAAAERPGVVKAVSSQVPFVNGLQSSLLFPLKYQPLAAWYGLRDLMRSDDEEPIYVPVIAPDAFAALICAECVEGYRKVVPAGATDADTRVAARVFMTLPWFSPADSAERIQAPTLVMAADNDGLIPIDGVRDMVKRIAKVEYVELKHTDHFAPYTGPVFEQVVARQTAFFRKHLQGR